MNDKLRNARRLGTAAGAAALLIVASQQTAAQEWAGSVMVNRVRLNGGTAFVGTTPQPANTCSNWGEHLTFDATTVQGKNWLAVFMTAKVSNRSVDVWYAPSSAPGTTQATSCNGAAISALQGVSLN